MLKVGRQTRYKKIIKRKWSRSEIIHHKTQGQGSDETLKNDLCYLCLRPTVDTALIPLCHTCFSKENQVQTYMHARIKFHACSDI
jgi:hypothetical protein